jgi:hypothetical protein
MVCLIDGWFAGWSGESPFTDSTPDQAVPRRLVWGCGCGWVEHFCCWFGFLRVDACGLMPGGLGTLLGPEGTPVLRGFSWCRSWFCLLMHPGWVWWGWWVGVWLCVECCIVDASIL